MANLKKAERDRLNSVASLGCIACFKLGYRDTPAEIHHIRTGMGMGQRNDHWHAIPLCPYHHRHGKEAIHQSRALFEKKFGTETELLNQVNEMLRDAA